MTAQPRNTILLGDARQRLRELPTDSVDCVITSPPYFAVRDYSHAGQLGQEFTVEAWVEGLRAVFREVARVLKPTGSLWLNLGDGYARRADEGAARKSLLLAPERLALALIADGWLLRNKVIWAKTNPMPSSVCDRLSCTYEVLYFFTQSPRYLFHLDAIRVPLRTKAMQTAGDPRRPYPPPEAQSPRSRNANTGLSRLKASGRAGHRLGKNPGDIWRLATANFRGAHFAVFPLPLAERPLLATCPPHICKVCGHAGNPPACSCQAGAGPGLVLDPFLGTGTTALVAGAAQAATGSASSSTRPTPAWPSSALPQHGRPHSVSSNTKQRKEVRWKMHHTAHGNSGSGNRPPGRPSAGRAAERPRPPMAARPAVR